MLYITSGNAASTRQNSRLATATLHIKKNDKFNFSVGLVSLVFECLMGCLTVCFPGCWYGFRLIPRLSGIILNCKALWAFCPNLEKRYINAIHYSSLLRLLILLRLLPWLLLRLPFRVPLRLILVLILRLLLWVPQYVELGANLTKNGQIWNACVCGRKKAA